MLNQGYQFFSNEYRKVGVKITINLCDILEKNFLNIRQELHKAGVTKCPIRKGTYQLFNWIPNTEKFPPLVPEGKWMIHMEWFTDFKFKKRIIIFEWYAIVKYVVTY